MKCEDLMGGDHDILLYCLFWSALLVNVGVVIFFLSAVAANFFLREDRF